MGKHSYGVVLDAGSSGTRVYVYNWLKPETARDGAKKKDLQSLPGVKTKKKWHKKVKPGVSTFGAKPEQVGADHLAPLIEFALDIVPEDEVENTPIFLLATAGMRLLPDYQRSALLSNICSYFQQKTIFRLPDCGLHVQVIPGETEGLYGWIAANYLLGGFDAPGEHDHGKGHHTYGFLDMGGASAQIAFAPNATEAEKHANDLKLLRLRKVNGDALEYRVFVTTWLGFGANEARRRYVDALVEQYPASIELPDPCLPAGLLVNKSGADVLPGTPELDGKEPHLLGTGKFAECLMRTYPLLEKDKPCEDSPCLLNGVHTPAIDFDVNHFVGVSEYWHTTHELFAMAHKDKAYDFHTYQNQVSTLCSRDWADIERDVAQQKWGKGINEKTVEEVCFKASWLINMLHDGIGVPRVGIEPVKQPSGVGTSNQSSAVIEKAKDRGFLDPFQAVDKIDGTEVSWTLGKMVLYASSQMPPTHEAFAVGFGSNVPGTALPMDFQFAGASHDPLPTDTARLEQEVDKLNWHTRLLTSSYSRRIPGILLILAILALALSLLCGRSLRRRLGNPSQPRKRRKPPAAGFLGSKFFSATPQHSYERVLESGAAADNDGGLELIDVIETDEQRIPRSHSSGWATPAGRGLSPDFTRTSPKGKVGYLDSSWGGGAMGVGNVGLIARTDSKEKLALAMFKESGGGRSRAGSPSRRSPLIEVGKER